MSKVIATNGSPAGIVLVDGISGVSGTIDTGTNGPGVLVPFTIPDENLFFFGGSIVATVGAGEFSDKCSLVSGDDGGFGLFVDMNTGDVTQDDANIAGTPTDSIEADPTITINYTMTGSPAPNDQHGGFDNPGGGFAN